MVRDDQQINLLVCRRCGSRQIMRHPKTVAERSGDALPSLAGGALVGFLLGGGIGAFIGGIAGLILGGSREG